MNLEDRIAKLERSNRRLSAGLVSVLVLAAGLGGMALSDDPPARKCVDMELQFYPHGAVSTVYRLFNDGAVELSEGGIWKTWPLQRDPNSYKRPPTAPPADPNQK